MLPDRLQRDAAMLSSDVLPLIDEAAARVYSVVTETPLVPMPLGSGANQAAAFAKLEQLQTTGSFKLRGATNKLMSLSKAEAAAGVITSSTGNHGLGVATSAKMLGIDAEVFLSSQVTSAKRRVAGAAARGYDAGKITKVSGTSPSTRSGCCSPC